mmetsp:Transcript_28052/g.52392  ORF Transcript_28052/g.52392 Transcript_28052/m.52392 type:complete len:325 (-) Transcript_28052:107-1081(-)
MQALILRAVLLAHREQRKHEGLTPQTPDINFKDMPVQLLRKHLRGIIVTANFDFSEELDNLIESILREEHKDRKLVNAIELKRTQGLPKIALWRGDITTLKIGAIVNAANNQMLGCFQPSHICIDNVIHSKAGPRLRKECRSLMKGKQLPTGDARMTKAYLLPADHVVHTVGPVFQGKLELGLLAKCYTNSLEVCVSQAVRSIAFCCISTGLFRYPKFEACSTAVKTVVAWLTRHPDKMDLVLFNTFDPQDQAIYQKVLAKVASSEAAKALQKAMLCIDNDRGDDDDESKQAGGDPPPAAAAPAAAAAARSNNGKYKKDDKAKR